MGSRIVEKLLADGHEVVAWNRSPEPVESIKYYVASRKQDKEHATSYMQPTTLMGEFTGVQSIENLVKTLKSPRIVWMMLPAGSATQTTLDEVSQYVQRGDILIDGGNAFYKNTLWLFGVTGWCNYTHKLLCACDAY